MNTNSLPDQAIDFLVRRDDLHATRTRSAALDPILTEGEVLMQIDRFAMTPNNVTYAAFGDAMSYWDFFPSNEDSRGRVPVRGFGTVIASRCEGVAVGERFYGYFPMSTHMIVRPKRAKESGFVDGSAQLACMGKCGWETRCIPVTLQQDSLALTISPKGNFDEL